MPDSATAIIYTEVDNPKLLAREPKPVPSNSTCHCGDEGCRCRCKTLGYSKDHMGKDHCSSSRIRKQKGPKQ
jgi:hypothetical protein